MDNNNTARNYETYTYEQPLRQPETRRETVKKVQTKSVPVSKLEGLLFAALGVVTMVLMIALVSVKVSTTITSQQLQKASNSLDSVTSKNVDLRQEVGELTSSQRLTQYAQQHNMNVSNANVRNVSK